MTVAVYTAMFGGYDAPPPQQRAQDIDVRWVAFTDGPDFPAPWETVRVAADSQHHPRIVAKRYKCVPAEYFDDRQSIWIDANTEIISPTFARETIAAMHDDIALFAHPERDCVFAEAGASVRLAPAKYAHTPIREQVAHYLAMGHPAHGGLYACGTIARNHTTVIELLGWRWLGDCVRWTYQDQLSFPVVCAELGVKPGVFPERQIGARGHFGNRWQRIHPHRSDR